MKTYIANRMGEYCSLQISSIKEVVANGTSPKFNLAELDADGVYESKTPFLIKNNSTDSIWLWIKPVNNADYVKTIIDPGWNPEICVGIKDVDDPSILQLGK